MAGGKRNKGKRIIPATSPTADTEIDDSLVDNLLAQLDSRDDSSLQQDKVVVRDSNNAEQDREKDPVKDDAPRKDSKSRFKARQMRKEAARMAQQAPNNEETAERIQQEIDDEERAIRQLCDSKDLELHEINPDGHCLFAAVADQLALLSILSPQNANYQSTRRAAADYIASHPDDFIPFLPLADGGEDGADATISRHSQEFTKYCTTIRETAAWGGELEILALANAYNIHIHIVQWGNPPVVVHSPSVGAAETGHTAHISYHRRMYGLGEHYNSLRPKS